MNSSLRVKIGLILLILLFVVPTAAAFDSRTGDTIVIAENEVVTGDLYVAANSLIINGVVEGDVVVGANTIEINGTVEGDLLAGAQEITINGTVADDVRAGASSFVVAGTVGHEILFGGFSANFRQGSSVGGDILVGGFQAVLDGDFAADVDVAANGVVVNGTIGDDFAASVESADSAPPFNPMQFNPMLADIPVVPSGLTIGNNAAIAGDLIYEAPQEAEFSAEVVAGDITFNQRQIEEEPTSLAQRWLDRLWDAVQSWLVLVLVGLALFWLTPRILGGSANALQKRFIWSGVWGIAIFFFLPIALVILLGVFVLLAVLLGAIALDSLAGTLLAIGLVLLLFILIVYIVAIAFLAKIIVGFRIGRILFTSAKRRFWPLAVGLLIVVLLTSIPFVGGLINFLIILFGIGALWLFWRDIDQDIVAGIQEVVSQSE